MCLRNPRKPGVSQREGTVLCGQQAGASSGARLKNVGDGRLLQRRIVQTITEHGSFRLCLMDKAMPNDICENETGLCGRALLHTPNVFREIKFAFFTVTPKDMHMRLI